MSKFPPITEFQPPSSSSIPASNTVAADLDGTLLLSSSSFPYFLLLSYKAGSPFRAFLLILISPLILFLYKFVSEPAAIRLLIFISIAGLKIKDIVLTSKTVLSEVYAGNVHPVTWKAFKSCEKRRVIVTANPRIMVEPFSEEYLGVDKVLGTELEVGHGGRATGFVKGPGVLVGKLKRDAVLREFAEETPDLGLGDRESDYEFMAICKEAYVVPTCLKRLPPARRLELCGGTKKDDDLRRQLMLQQVPYILKPFLKTHRDL